MPHLHGPGSRPNRAPAPLRSRPRVPSSRAPVQPRGARAPRAAGQHAARSRPTPRQRWRVTAAGRTPPRVTMAGRPDLSCPCRRWPRGLYAGMMARARPAASIPAVSSRNRAWHSHDRNADNGIPGACGGGAAGRATGAPPSAPGRPRRRPTGSEASLLALELVIRACQTFAATSRAGSGLVESPLACPIRQGWPSSHRGSAASASGRPLSAPVA